MKKQIATLLCLLALTGCSASPAHNNPMVADAPTSLGQVTETPDAAEEPEKPVALGSFEAQTLTGETVSQEIFSQADLTVLNLWATFCGPCKEEMPVLAALDQEYDNVQVVGIVTDAIDQKGNPDPEQVDLALALCESAGVTYPNLILNQSLAEIGLAGMEAVPATLFVDSNGTLVGLGFYGALSEDGWRQEISARLEMLS